MRAWGNKVSQCMLTLATGLNKIFSAACHYDGPWHEMTGQRPFAQAISYVESNVAIANTLYCGNLDYECAPCLG